MEILTGFAKLIGVELQKALNESDAVIMGRKTYEASGSYFPYGKILNVVLTKNPSLHKETDRLLFTDKSPKELVDYLTRKGLKKLLVIGGGVTNSSFLRENLIDTLVLSIHPLILGEGIKLFEDIACEKSLTLVGTKTLNEDLVQVRYKVEK